MAVTISGTLLNSDGSYSANSAVTFRLTNLGGNLPYISGTNIIVPIIVTATTNSSGVFSLSLQGNDTITPANTVYDVSFAGNQTASYNFTGAGPFNLNSYPPLVVFPTPTGPTPTNILSGLNTFTQANAFNAAVTVNSSLTVAGVAALNTATTSGKVTQYNGINTAGNGIPAVYGSVALTAQSAAITPTTLYAVPAGGVGTYRISWVAKVTQASDNTSVLGGSTGFQVTYTDADDSTVLTTAAQSPAFIDTRYLFAQPTAYGNALTTQLNGVIVVHAKASTNIQYQFGYLDTHTTTAMNYNLRIKIEAV